MTTLNLGPDLKLPLETATETALIVGKRGGGKSNTAVAMAEELYRAHVPFAVLDPVDTWYGLKAGQDGKPDGGALRLSGHAQGQPATCDSPMCQEHRHRVSGKKDTDWCQGHYDYEQRQAEAEVADANREMGLPEDGDWGNQ